MGSAWAVHPIRCVLNEIRHALSASTSHESLSDRRGESSGIGLCCQDQKHWWLASYTIESSCAGRLGVLIRELGECGLPLKFCLFFLDKFYPIAKRNFANLFPTHRFSWKCHWPKTALNFVWIDSFLHRHFAWQNLEYLLWLGCWAVCFLSNIGLWMQENKYRAGAMSPFLFYGLIYGFMGQLLPCKTFLEEKSTHCKLWKKVFSHPLLCYFDKTWHLYGDHNYITRRDFRKKLPKLNYWLLLHNLQIGNS